MNAVLWLVQGVLALAYLIAGMLKATQPIQRLGKRMDWVLTVPPMAVRTIGVLEILGAVGLILPLATGILPGLTVAAAAGLVVVQIGAAALHGSRGEANRLPMNAVLLLLAAFIVYGRLALVPA